MAKDGKHLKILRAALLSLCLVIFPVGVALAASGGEQGHGEKGWVATDTFRVMNFAVLAGGLIFLLRKPLSQALSGRIKGIQDQLDELEAKKKEAEKELAAYTEKLAFLDQEAQKLIDAYVKQGQEAKARILQEAETAAKKLEEQAQRNIEHEFNQAKLKLQEEAFEKALVKAEELIRSKVTDEDQERLVDEYLKKVVA